MSAPVMANESVSHGAETTPKPRPFGNRRVGHPEKRTGKPTPSLGVDVLEWYYRPHAFVKKKNGKRVRHPPNCASRQVPTKTKMARREESQRAARVFRAINSALCGWPSSCLS